MKDSDQGLVPNRGADSHNGDQFHIGVHYFSRHPTSGATFKPSHTRSVYFVIVSYGGVSF